MALTEQQRSAPVQASAGTEAGRVPWAVHALAWRVYHDAGHRGQSAERIAERHGFSWAELVALLRGEYSRRAIDQARADLLALTPEPSEQPREGA